MATSILYLTGGPLAVRSDGQLGFHAKTLSGLHEYARRIDGGVWLSSLQPPIAASGDEPGFVWMGEEQGGTVQVISQLTVDEIRQRAFSLVQTAVNTPGAGDLVGQPFATLFYDDYSPAVRTDVALFGAKSSVDVARIRFGAIRRTRQFTALAREADGFQTNGYAAYDHYSKVNPNTLLFIDHRITTRDLGESAPQRTPGSPLSLAFSGRLIEMKGTRYIPQLVRELNRRGVSVDFAVIGAGPLEAELRRDSPANVRFVGFLDFEEAWKDFVRTEIDVMFLPHLQGDSSSTYYESMGCGVPVLGFSNATLTPTLRHGGGGWEVPRGDVRAAADVIAEVARDPAVLLSQRRRALDFVTPLTTERVFDSRVEHFHSTIEIATRARAS